MPIRKKNPHKCAQGLECRKKENKDSISREREQKSHLSFIVSIGGMLYRNTKVH